MSAPIAADAKRNVKQRGQARAPVATLTLDSERESRTFSLAQLTATQATVLAGLLTEAAGLVNATERRTAPRLR